MRALISNDESKLSLIEPKYEWFGRETFKETFPALKASFER